MVEFNDACVNWQRQAIGASVKTCTEQNDLTALLNACKEHVVEKAGTNGKEAILTTGSLF